MKALEQWLELTGRNKSDLADALGISRQAVGAWFLGKAEPSVEMLRELHKLTQIPYEKLIDRDAA